MDIVLTNSLLSHSSINLSTVSDIHPALLQMFLVLGC